MDDDELLPEPEGQTDAQCREHERDIWALLRAAVQHDTKAMLAIIRGGNAEQIAMGLAGGTATAVARSISGRRIDPATDNNDLTDAEAADADLYFTDMLERCRQELAGGEET